MEVSTELAIRSALVDALDKIFFPIELQHNMAQLDESCITHLGTMFRLWPTFVLALENSQALPHGRRQGDVDGSISGAASSKISRCSSASELSSRA